MMEINNGITIHLRSQVRVDFLPTFFQQETDNTMPHSTELRSLSIPDRIRNLAQKREDLLAMAPEKAMDAILEYPEARALVHSFSEPDLYLLIHQIGLNDSHPLLELASTRQWLFMLDMECWEQDRLNDAALSRWMNHLTAADPRRTIEWLVREETELIEWYLFRHLELYIREHDQDLADIPEDAVTLDGMYYFRIRPASPAISESEPNFGFSEIEDREQFLFGFLDRLARQDHGMFQNILWESRGCPSADIEEELYRQRNGRMAEKGFLPFEEAIGVYQPVRPENIPSRPPLARHKDTTSGSGPLPRYAENIFFGENRLMDSRSLPQDDPLREDITLEITALTNRIAMADQKEISSRSDLEAIAAKIRGYLEIGIETVTEATPTPTAAIRLFRKHLLTDLFRVGYREALLLKSRAKKWVRNSWFQSIPLPLSFWTESKMGTLGGLLLKRPLCYDSSLASGSLYREFRSMADIRLVSQDLEETIQLDQLLFRVFGRISGHSFHRKKKTGITWQNLILTRWACVETGHTAPDDITLDLATLRRFLASMWEHSWQPQIPNDTKIRFLTWLSATTDLSASDITRSVGQALDALFDDLESELGAVSLSDLDPRFIRHFLLREPYVTGQRPAIL